MKKQKNYKATYYNANDRRLSVALLAKTLIGAKREATRKASGDHTLIILYANGKPVSQRVAPDDVAGFCNGWGRWWRPEKVFYAY